MSWRFALVVCFAFGSIPSLADDVSATQPVGTGEVDFTFTQRSPISKPKELARRLNLKPRDMGDDYDLSQRPFKACVPKNYDPATPVGIFVYLGYKDTVSVPPLWEPVLENSHLIFISPVCHSGEHYQPSVPMWQTMGLALDAVFNLKNQYAIDPMRVYLMSWDPGSTQMSIAVSDVFTGCIDTGDLSYFKQLTAADGHYWPPTGSWPPDDLVRLAQTSAHPD